MNSNVSVIIPVYNEALNIEDVINGVKKYCENIIVVDDKSTDSTKIKILKYKNKVDKIILHKINLGKGAAIKSAQKFP